MGQIFQKTKYWTKEEEDYLKEHYLEMDNHELSDYINRTPSAIKGHLQKMGLQRPDPFFNVKKKSFKKMTKKIPFNQIKSEFEKRGYILLSEEDDYKNGSSKLRYICEKHKNKGELITDYNHFKTGRGCTYCGREKTALAKRSKITQDEDKKLCEIKGFKYIRTVRENGKYYIYFICPKHEILGEQKMVRGNMNREFVNGCQYCIDRNLPEWYVKQKIHEDYPNLSVVSEYKGMYKELICYCSIHNEYFTNQARQIYHWGYGCSGCTADNRGNASRLTIDEVERRLKENLPYLEALNANEYTKSNFKVLFRCKTCGYEFYSNYHYAVDNHTLCPKCSMRYHGEQKIREYLLANNISHVPQLYFDDCRGDKNPLPFDFAIYNDNDELYGLIEYQGEGHYMPVKHFGGEERFRQQIKYDNIKREYCYSNNINLLEIPYTEYNNINEILDEFITF